MDREEFKLRMKSLKSYRELNPGKGYWDWKVEAFQPGGVTGGDDPDKELKRSLGIAEYILKYDKMPTDDSKVIDQYIDKIIWPMENPNNVGMRDDGLYYVYTDKDSDGVTRKNIGPGIESHSNMGRKLKYDNSEGYTKEELNDLVLEDMLKGTARIVNSLNTMQNGKYYGVWDTLSTGPKMTIYDIYHNVKAGRRGNLPEKWPKLIDAISKGNLEEAKKQTYSGSVRRQKLRNGLLHYELGGETGDDTGDASLQYIEQRHWLENWFRNRPKQMAENIDAYTDLIYYGSSLTRSKVSPWFWLSKEKNAKRVTEHIIDQIRDTPVFDYREPWISNDKNTLNRNEFLKLPADTQGAYFKNYPEKNAISISPITRKPAVLVHELTHASQGEYGIQTSKVDEILRKHQKENGKKHRYYDNPNEVYAREMEFRYLNNILPEDVITKEQIEKWKKDDDIIDPDFISRYSTNTLEELLNGVAQAYDFGGETGDPIKGSYSNHTGTPTMYVPVTEDYEATPDGFGEIANAHTPEVVVTPKDNISLEAAVDRGRRDAAPYVGAIVGGAVTSAMSGAGLLSPIVNPVDIASVAINPSDPLNWLPFGLHFGNRVYKAGRLILDPKKRAAHAYVNIVPVGYNDAGKRAMYWISDMLKGKDADINHPKWDLDDIIYYGAIDYIPRYVKNRGNIAAYTRDDAWRIYNGLEPKYGMYIKNSDGTYSYNMPKIIEMSEGTFKPYNFHKTDTPIDYVTGSGGGLTKYENEDIAKQGSNMFAKTYGVQTIEDVWDLLPFSRPTDLILDRYSILRKPFLLYNRVGFKINDMLNAVSDRLKYDNKAIKNYMANASDYEMEVFDPDMFSKSGLRYDIGKRIEALSEKIRPKKSWYEYKPILKLNEFGKKFEVGDISGGKPFKMHTEIPYTNYLTSYGSDIAKKWDYGFTPNDGMVLPPEVTLYKTFGRLNKIPDIKLNKNFNIGDIIKEL